MIREMASAAGSGVGQRFRVLADAAVGLLHERDEPAWVANAYLHPRNAHPANLGLYEPWLQNRDEPRRSWKTNFANLRAAILAIGGKPIWNGDDVEGPFDVLLVSHFLRPEQSESHQDNYYGDLPQRLAQSGLRCAIVLIDHTEVPWRQLAPRWKPHATPRLLLAPTLSLSQELLNGRALAAAAGHLKSGVGRASTLSEIAERAAGYANTPVARSAMRIGGQIGLIAKQLRPRLLVTTYEGHAWERLAFKAARDAVPGIRCVGYSHAVLFPEPRAMIAALGRGFDPDVVLTAGAVTRDKLAAMMPGASPSVGILGSVRRGAATANANRERRCLVLPEGLVSESLSLISAAADAANRTPDINFRIRLHPVLSREKLLGQVPSLQNLPANVEWSEQGPLDADLSAARWLLYRGTSAVFQAVEAGLRPIYLGLPNEPFSIDPLSGLDAWRLNVPTGTDLASVLTDDVISPTDVDGLARARAYCADYFSPLDPQILIDLVHTPNSAPSRVSHHA